MSRQFGQPIGRPDHRPAVSAEFFGRNPRRPSRLADFGRPDNRLGLGPKTAAEPHRLFIAMSYLLYGYDTSMLRRDVAFEGVPSKKKSLPRLSWRA